MVAGPGLEPRAMGHEPIMLPLHQPALFGSPGRIQTYNLSVRSRVPCSFGYGAIIHHTNIQRFLLGLQIFPRNLQNKYRQSLYLHTKFYVHLA